MLGYALPSFESSRYAEIVEGLMRTKCVVEPVTDRAHWDELFSRVEQPSPSAVVGLRRGGRGDEVGRCSQRLQR